MLTQRDRQILRFVEEHGGITIYQCSKVFFTDCKHGYDLARKRLKVINDMSLLNYYTNKLTNERVYCNGEKKTPHHIYLTDVYATFIQYGCKVIKFKREPQWMGGKYRSDGFFLVEYNGKARMCLVEVDVTHSTKMEKYEEIFKSKEIQQMFGTFPMIIIVGDILSEYHSDNFDTVYLDYKLNGFAEKVLAL